jgi:hypothetical protein
MPHPLAASSPRPIITQRPCHATITSYALLLSEQHETLKYNIRMKQIKLLEHTHVTYM